MLTIPKPLDPHEWLADSSACEEFYQAFRGCLIKIIADQLNILPAVVESLFTEYFSNTIKENVYECMFMDERDEEQKRAVNAYELADQLKSTVFEVKNIHFPVSDNEGVWDYQGLFSLVPKIHFVGCHFYCADFNAKLLQPRFTGCTFHQKYLVAEWDAPEDEKPLFAVCRFIEKVTISGNELCQFPVNGYSVVFSNCELNSVNIKNAEVDTRLFSFSVEKPAQLKKIKLKNCIINKKISLANVKDFQSIELTSTVFSRKFALINCQCQSVVIKDTNFNQLADFYKSQFEIFLIKKSIFRDFTGFENCYFGSEGLFTKTVRLNYVTFYSFINFRGAVFNQPLDLRNTNRQEQPNFLDARFKATAIQGTDRETFRIIKHSFDAVGNHIEANKYFARELQAYRKELKQEAEPMHRRERILLWLNAQISNHGQNYLRPAAWLLLTILVTALVLANDKQQWLVPTSCWWASLTNMLNGFAIGFLPVNAMVGQDKEHLAFMLLLSTLMASTFTWHLLVAIRRHSKR